MQTHTIYLVFLERASGMKNTYKLRIIIIIFFIGIVVITCDNGNSPTGGNGENKTPVASDYTIGNLNQTAGSVAAVTIIANSGKSPGMVANIRYNGSTTIPQSAGTYTITFDVFAISGWNAVTGLSAGNLVVSNPVNKTPVASDYTIGNLNQTAESVTAVTIIANSGKSSGMVSNIRYNGSTIIPQSTGTYPVTFDVLAVTGWNAVTGLSAGNLVVDNQTPVADDYTTGNLNQTAESVTAVTIIANSGKSSGTVNNIRYNGSTTIPQSTGTYPVTFDVLAVTGWNAVTGLSAGNLVVGNQTPVTDDYTIGNLNQTTKSVTAVTLTPQPGKSTGNVTIFYNGSTTLPTVAGSYTVTFNVTAVTGWNAATGLAGGILTIIAATGIEIGNPSIRLYVNGNTSPLEEGVNTQIAEEIGTYTVSITAGTYSEITWYVNGIVISQGTTNTSIVLTKRIAGTYLITVEATMSGIKNTGSHCFTIQ